MAFGALRGLLVAGALCVGAAVVSLLLAVAPGNEQGSGPMLLIVPIMLMAGLSGLPWSLMALHAAEPTVQIMTILGGILLNGTLVGMWIGAIAGANRPAKRRRDLP